MIIFQMAARLPQDRSDVMDMGPSWSASRLDTLPGEPGAGQAWVLHTEPRGATDPEHVQCRCG